MAPHSLAAAPLPPPTGPDTSIFDELESGVRSYCRAFPTVFTTAAGAVMEDEQGRRYLDFLSGAGALNYGHNPPFMRQGLIDHLVSGQIVQALDLHTPAKRAFLEAFQRIVLRPRALDHKVQFCGPTGANSVEAALKLARTVTGRASVMSFTGGWHGMTAGCLAVTGNKAHRAAAGVPLGHVLRVPFATGPSSSRHGLALLRESFLDPSSGIDVPAAALVETVQAEGGVHVAPTAWLQELRSLCDDFGIVLIVDDIQAGCGRAGTFFSFERAGIVPDLVCLSKSISGYGLPMSLLLIRPDLDRWQPGDHTGTFRGHQLAFVAATSALELWESREFEESVAHRAATVDRFLHGRIASLHAGIEVRGIGMLWAVDLRGAGGQEVAGAVARRCFDHGLVIERCGRDDTALKLLPPLTIDLAQLLEGLEILAAAIGDELAALGAAP